MTIDLVTAKIWGIGRLRPHSFSRKGSEMPGCLDWNQKTYDLIQSFSNEPRSIDDQGFRLAARYQKTIPPSIIYIVVFPRNLSRKRKLGPLSTS